jgi:hypothetical protein
MPLAYLGWEGDTPCAASPDTGPGRSAISSFKDGERLVLRGGSMQVAKSTQLVFLCCGLVFYKPLSRLRLFSP